MLPEFHVFALPLRHRFRGITVREGVLFEGPNGWAEFAPFKDHTDEHAGRWLSAAIEQAFGQWPALVRQVIPVNAIIPETDASTAGVLAGEAIAHGCTTIKTKVGEHSFDDDVARVAAIRSAFDDAGAQGAIRVDANARWTLPEAIERIRVLDAIAGGLEYVEQPLADTAELAALRRSIDVRIAVDESIRLAEDPVHAIAALQSVADVAILKSIPLGGVLPALELADAAQLPIVVSGSLDSSVGLASGLWLAGSIAELPLACGLGTGDLLDRDVVSVPQQIVDGGLRVQRSTPEDPDPSGLVTDVMIEYWRARVERAWKYANTELVR